MIPDGDVVGIEVMAGNADVANYRLMWKDGAFRLSTTTFRTNTVAPTQLDIVRGNDPAEGMRLFVERINAYLRERHKQIEAARAAAHASIGLERPGFRPGYFKQQASRQDHLAVKWRTEASRKIRLVLQSAAEHGWPRAAATFPWEA